MVWEKDGEIHSGTLNLLDNKVSIKETGGDVGLSNILYSERFKEGSKFFFGREPGQGAHR